MKRLLMLGIQFVKQSLCVFEIGGDEALGRPAMNPGEDSPRLQIARGAHGSDRFFTTAANWPDWMVEQRGVEPPTPPLRPCGFTF
jgi:hypothetical protein